MLDAVQRRRIDARQVVRMDRCQERLRVAHLVAEELVRVVGALDPVAQQVPVPDHHACPGQRAMQALFAGLQLLLRVPGLGDVGVDEDHFAHRVAAVSHRIGQRADPSRRGTVRAAAGQRLLQFVGDGRDLHGMPGRHALQQRRNALRCQLRIVEHAVAAKRIERQPPQCFPRRIDRQRAAVRRQDPGRHR